MKSYMLVKKFEIEVVLLQVLCHNFIKVCVFLVNIRLLSIKILKVHSQTYFFPTLAPLILVAIYTARVTHVIHI